MNKGISTIVVFQITVKKFVNTISRFQVWIFLATKNISILPRSTTLAPRSWYLSVILTAIYPVPISLSFFAFIYPLLLLADIAAAAV